jgi:hypothetical protein
MKSLWDKHYRLWPWYRRFPWRFRWLTLQWWLARRWEARNPGQHPSGIRDWSFRFPGSVPESTWFKPLAGPLKKCPPPVFDFRPTEKILDSLMEQHNKICPTSPKKDEKS